MTDIIGYRIAWVQAMSNGRISRSSTTPDFWKDKEEAERVCAMLNKAWRRSMEHWVEEVTRKKKSA